MIAKIIHRKKWTHIPTLAKPPMEPIINPAGTIIGYIFNQ